MQALAFTFVRVVHSTPTLTSPHADPFHLHLPDPAFVHYLKEMAVAQVIDERVVIILQVELEN